MSQINYKMLFPEQMLSTASSSYLTQSVVPLPRNPPTHHSSLLFQGSLDPILNPKMWVLSSLGNSLPVNFFFFFLVRLLQNSLKNTTRRGRMEYR